ncbi:HAMP domain-containing protein [Streptomyces sp. AJS327]|uniref:HAMP domain-containing sensor histidine kinase n=1 Tax=Streptomyces sp. AJS327 TaxID=2545265 RepID=UPI0015DF47EC|nr:HAMP domain-containing sensor histidine kinase [Streptomyces sp. AJS327]MBA0050556.1 HAMP domain-containing protein [Streptomyces sp. AJS327]
MSLFWRIFLLNALVLVTATVVLLWAPVTVSVPVVLTEAVVVTGGMLAMLLANGFLLRLGLAPLQRLNRLMQTIDLLRPGQRLPASGQGDIPDLLRAFNEMLDRLETERGDSSARALSAQEAERRRVAQELHDEVGQSLTAVLLDLKRIADHAPDAMRADLRQAQETTRASLDEVRRVAHRLRPGVLEDLGLVSALTELAEEFAAHSGLTVRRDFAAPLPPLGGEVELVLYRVAQESLTNTARHADASGAELSLRSEDGRVVLRVRDDGRGLGASGEGAGLRGMRERALLVGGELNVGTRRGGGTEVRLRVPLDHGSRAAPPAPRAEDRTPAGGASASGPENRTQEGE